MAENEQDDSQKTEEPSQRKLDEAAKKGDVPQSQEFKHFMVLLGGALAFVVAAGPAAEIIRAELAGFIAHAHDIPTGPGGILRFLRDSGGRILLALLMPLGIVFFFALAGAGLQHKPIFTGEKIKPTPDKISPLKGVQRTFSKQRLVEFLKTIAKFVTVGALLVWLLWPEPGGLRSAVRLSMPGILERISDLALLALLIVLAAMAIIAAIDFAFQRVQHHEKMRMTKQEVKDEQKQMEGDPQVKARLREIRQEKSKKRMMAKVPEADVVVSNPTHYAVALEYKHGQMEAPVVLAKGVDAVARRIRETAEEHAIPVVENPPLAQALYASVDLDEEIPSEHYQAVAEVISYVLRLKKRGRAGGRPQR